MSGQTKHKADGPKLPVKQLAILGELFLLLTPPILSTLLL